MKRNGLRKRNNTDYRESEASFTCLIMAGLGFSALAVSEVTGLRKSQQDKVLTRWGVRRVAYRDGLLNCSKMIQRLAGKRLQAVILSECKQIEE